MNVTGTYSDNQGNVMTQNEITLGLLIRSADKHDTHQELISDLMDAMAFVIAGYDSPETHKMIIAQVAKHLPEAVESYRAKFDEPCDDPECPVHGVKH